MVGSTGPPNESGRNEPDPYLKQAYEFGVLEHVDHLYRYANLFEMVERRRAAKIVDGVTEVMPGRPTMLQRRHPYSAVTPMTSRAVRTTATASTRARSCTR